MKITKLILGISFLLSLGCSSVFACRFNVRDVGFVDLENHPYVLFCYINNSTEKYITDDFKELANAELPQTNIKARTISVDLTPDHPLMQYLKPPAKTFPVFVLISPDGKTMAIEPIEKGQDFKDSLQKAIEKIVSSPMRKEIIEKTIDAFGVVLIIEGPDAEENKKAVTAAQASVKMIASQMDSLPKAISKPPVMLKMNRQQQTREEILLWSMGIAAENITRPHVIIFYGRGRRMGSVLSGKDLTREMLLKYLFVIGADCECGLDRSWMQGAMMPAKWSKEQLKKMSGQLGFDTEHPMVKMEMSQIIGKGKQSGKKLSHLDAIGGFGYQEIEVKFDKPESAKQIDSKSESDVQAPDASLKDETVLPVEPSIVIEQTEIEEDEFQLWNPLYLVGITGAVVLLASIYFIYASGKKR